MKETAQDYKEREIENINAMGSRSRGVTGLRDVDSLNLILTPAQQKEIQKDITDTDVKDIVKNESA